jgi:hypothetical protein
MMILLYLIKSRVHKINILGRCLLFYLRLLQRDVVEVFSG